LPQVAPKRRQGVPFGPPNGLARQGGGRKGEPGALWKVLRGKGLLVRGERGFGRRAHFELVAEVGGHVFGGLGFVALGEIADNDVLEAHVAGAAGVELEADAAVEAGVGSVGGLPEHRSINQSGIGRKVEDS